MSCAQCASPQVVKQLLERDLPLTVPPTMAVRPRIALSNSEPACACAPRLAHLHSRHTLAGWLAVYGGGGMHLHAMQPNGTKNNNDADDAMADVNVSSSFIYLYVCVVLCCLGAHAQINVRSGALSAPPSPPSLSSCPGASSRTTRARAVQSRAPSAQAFRASE